MYGFYTTENKKITDVQKGKTSVQTNPSLKQISAVTVPVNFGRHYAQPGAWADACSFQAVCGRRPSGVTGDFPA